MMYVIQVRAGHERRALSLIEKMTEPQLYQEIFIPQYETMKRFRGEWQLRTETLLPGYLFVITNQPSAMALQLRKVPEFTRLLGNDDMFTPLADQEAALIGTFTDIDHRTIRMSEGVIEGDEIVILKGPLMNQQALIKKVDRHKRIAYLELEMLGRTVNVKVGLEIVRKSA